MSNERDEYWAKVEEAAKDVAEKSAELNRRLAQGPDDPEYRSRVEAAAKHAAEHFEELNERLR